jgi:hypothetical protein
MVEIEISKQWIMGEREFVLEAPTNKGEKSDSMLKVYDNPYALLASND